LAKANQATTVNVDLNSKYRGSRWGGDVNGSAYYQNQQDADPTSRANITLNGIRFTNTRWAGYATVGLTTNEQLSLDLRTSVGGGAQYIALLNSRQDLFVRAGLVVTQEQFSASDPPSAVDSLGMVPDSTPEDGSNTNSLELSLNGTWDRYKYDHPKLNVNVSLTPYISLTALGRVRFEFNTAVTYEVFHNFNVGFTVRDSYDSQPPQEGASKNDYTFSLTVGWPWT
jgi:hypothetical protein